MSSYNPIGGFLGLDVRAGKFLHHDALLLGSGRNCFEYVLRAAGIKRVYLPKFTCDAMLEPLARLNIPHEFYAINDNLELESELEVAAGEALVYTNYFGLKTTYSEALSAKYAGNLILDYSQAFFADPPAGSHTFYSPRKFFGLPDGGCLYTPAHLDEELPQAVSAGRSAHLLLRLDQGAEAAYADFQAGEHSLSGRPLEQMSNLTRALLGNLDLESVRRARRANYAVLETKLKPSNRLKLELGAADVPLVYPYLSDDAGLRQKLIGRKIFVPQYWPNVLEWAGESDYEYQLTAKLLPLPIDQRYGRPDMARVLEALDESQP
jgi:hypothetical protein